MKLKINESIQLKGDLLSNLGPFVKEEKFRAQALATIDIDSY